MGKKGPGVFALPSLVKIAVVNKPATPQRMGISPFTKQEQVFAAKGTERPTTTGLVSRLLDACRSVDDNGRHKLAKENTR